MYIYMYIFVYIHVLFFSGQKQHRSRNGQKFVVFRKFFEKIEALDPNINILISKYAPKCKKYRKDGPNKFFPHMQPPVYFPIM